MRVVLIITILSLLISTSFAKSKALKDVQPRVLIDCPTAGVLPKGYYDVDLRFFANGGTTFAINVGLSERFMLGISYQVGKLIGNDIIDPQKSPLGTLKYRLIEETYFFPAIALGLDMQGHAQQLEDETFYYKSKGFYITFSKSYMFANFPVDFHYGANYSTENLIVTDVNVSKNNFVNGFIGLNIGLTEGLMIFSEYDLAMDDNFTHNPMYGFLNLGARWEIANNFVVEIDFKDCINNKWQLNQDSEFVDLEADFEYLKNNNQLTRKYMTRELRCTFLTQL